MCSLCRSVLRRVPCSLGHRRHRRSEPLCKCSVSEGRGRSARHGGKRHSGRGTVRTWTVLKVHSGSTDTCPPPHRHPHAAFMAPPPPLDGVPLPTGPSGVDERREHRFGTPDRISRSRMAEAGHAGRTGADQRARRVHSPKPCVVQPSWGHAIPRNTTQARPNTTSH